MSLLHRKSQPFREAGLQTVKKLLREESEGPQAL